MQPHHASQTAAPHRLPAAVLNTCSTDALCEILWFLKRAYWWALPAALCSWRRCACLQPLLLATAAAASPKGAPAPLIDTHACAPAPATKAVQMGCCDWRLQRRSRGLLRRRSGCGAAGHQPHRQTPVRPRHLDLPWRRRHPVGGSMSCAACCCALAAAAGAHHGERCGMSNGVAPPAPAGEPWWPASAWCCCAASTAPGSGVTWLSCTCMWGSLEVRSGCAGVHPGGRVLRSGVDAVAPAPRLGSCPPACSLCRFRPHNTPAEAKAELQRFARAPAPTSLGSGAATAAAFGPAFVLSPTGVQVASGQTLREQEWCDRLMAVSESLPWEWSAGRLLGHAAECCARAALSPTGYGVSAALVPPVAHAAAVGNGGGRAAVRGECAAAAAAAACG